MNSNDNDKLCLLRKWTAGDISKSSSCSWFLLFSISCDSKESCWGGGGTFLSGSNCLCLPGLHRWERGAWMQPELRLTPSLPSPQTDICAPIQNVTLIPTASAVDFPPSIDLMSSKGSFPVLLRSGHTGQNTICFLLPFCLYWLQIKCFWMVGYLESFLTVVNNNLCLLKIKRFLESITKMSTNVNCMYNTVGLMEQKERELTETTVFLSAVYSADVLDGHRAPPVAPAERCDDTLLPQNKRLASVSADRRAVIILVPVRLGGEKTNPDYFNLAKVRRWNAAKSETFGLKSSVFPFRAFWVWTTASASLEGSPNRPATLLDSKVGVSLL